MTAPLRVHNRTAGAMALSVRVVQVSDVPGAFGGLLSPRLLLDLTTTDRRRLVRAAPAELRAARDLGTVAPNATRTFALRLAFLDGGPPPSPTGGDNALQGASARLVLELTGRT
ncbi:MAG TPA: hypothetical protein VD931_13305 [Baekduia sp.]|nr:hypothetical protein [Baekduia sp.]